MTTPPQLFDRDLLALRRRRAVGGDAWFLQQTAADLVTERLAEVNRSFRRAALIGPVGSLWRECLAPGLTGAEIELHEDAERLHLDAGAHDLILHTLWLHGANDPLGVLIQSRLALKPDGLMIAGLFGGRTLQELRASLAEAESALTGGLSPRVAPMAEIRDLGGLLQRAGFAMPVADAELLDVSYGGLTGLMHDLRAMGETNIQTARLRQPTRRGLFQRAEAAYRAHWGGQGRIPATFELIFLTGWAPAEGQPRPLRPGSASHRLADALGTGEWKLPTDND